MEKVLIGAGGFAREIKADLKLDIKCFVDDEYYQENNLSIFKMSEFDINKHIALVAIGNPKDREIIVNKLPKGTKFWTFISKNAIIMNNVLIGYGTCICAGVIITTDVVLGKHNQLNLQTTIGHDTVIGDYFTTAPSVNISGNCVIGDRVYFGTNSCVREKIIICNDVTIGLNSGIVSNINQSGLYVGTPSKKIK